MFVEFECFECGTSFGFHESELLSKDSLSCPACKKRVPKKFLNQLDAFIIENNTVPFKVRFSEAPRISMAVVEQYSLKGGVELLSEFYDGIKVDNLADILGPKEFIAVQGMIQGAITGYHFALKDSLALSGLKLGDIFRLSHRPKTNE